VFIYFRLGLKSLLHPFKWCHVLVPVFPKALVELLEAPLPILAGIMNSQMKCLTVDPNEDSFRNWVFLDQGKIQWGCDPVPMPNFKGVTK
jgi:hypothetical protein